MTMEHKKKEIIIVGGGLAGLSCAMRACELGMHVKIISITKVKRSHSVCAQGGINAALNAKQEGDSPFIHAYETIKGGDFLAEQPPVLEMCLSAPGLISMMERLGCPFNRTPEGNLDVRRFGGTLYHRTVFAGASTGQQLLYSLDEQVRRYEVQGHVEKYENHEFMRAIIDSDGRTRGIVLMDLFNQSLQVLKADAVVIATGGLGALFRKSTNSVFCTGAANARLFRQGMHYANGEFIQIHPTAIPGWDKMRLMSESARGEGGRLWVYGDSTKSIMNPQGQLVPCGITGVPWYFLEELYPLYGNLVPRDIASRVILNICTMGLGIDGEMQVYLDLTELPPERFKKLTSILEIYEKFTGEDPKKVPMRIFPAVHYSMGGAWVDWPASDDPDRFMRFRQMTNLTGLFNVGESDFQYHGANRLGANSLLSCLFGGLITAQECLRYIEGLKESYHNIPELVFEESLKKEEEIKLEILSRTGPENVFKLSDELADFLVQYVTVTRNNKDLVRTIDKIKEIKERAKNIDLRDTSRFQNQSYIFANEFDAMLELALVITKSALLRDESRGSHFKTDFPERDDKNWLKTTVAEYAVDEPKIFYKDVEMRYIKPRVRDYTKKDTESFEFTNLPDSIPLPV